MSTPRPEEPETSQLEQPEPPTEESDDQTEGEPVAYEDDSPTGEAAESESPPSPEPEPQAASAAPSANRQQPQSHAAAFVLIALAVVGLVVLNVVLWVNDDNETEGGADQSLAIGRINPEPGPRPAFTLTDVEGNPFDFATATADQLTFLFFGYTNCPDICPIQMATLSAALAEMQGVSARIVFVTTDPQRDTSERLRSWLGNFDRPIIGLTGTAEQVADAQRATGVTVAISEAPDAGGAYLVGHAAAVLVYTPDNLQHVSFGSGTTQTEWVQGIREIDANNEWGGGPA